MEEGRLQEQETSFLLSEFPLPEPLKGQPFFLPY